MPTRNKNNEDFSKGIYTQKKMKKICECQFHAIHSKISLTQNVTSEKVLDFFTMFFAED